MQQPYAAATRMAARALGLKVATTREAPSVGDKARWPSGMAPHAGYGHGTPSVERMSLSDTLPSDFWILWTA
jgi:hypothetical protein